MFYKNRLCVIHVPSPYASLWRKSISPRDKCSLRPSLERSRRKKNAAQSDEFGEIIRERVLDFSGGSAGKESAHSRGYLSSIPGSGRSPGEGNDNPLQFYRLENSTDRGAWWGYSP